MASTAAPQATSTSRPESSRLRAARRTADVVVIAGVTLATIWLRVDGLGPSSLWLDDAWVALAGRTDGLDELRRVGFTSPGFALVLRAWFAVVGFSEVAAQAVPFAAGAAAPGLAYLVGRRLGWQRAAAVVPALVLVSSPMAMDYSTRVKQYTLEAVLALGLLAVALHLLDDVRSTRRWGAFVGAAALATTVSAFVAPYAAAGVAAALLRAARHRDRVGLRRGIIAAGVYGGFAGTWYLAALRPVVTDSVSGFWSGHYLEVGDGPARATADLVAAVTGVVGGLTGLPVGGMVLALLAAAGVLALRRPEHAALLVTPTLVAVVLAAAQVAPLGGGRTDIYLYPSLALLLGAGAHAVVVALPRGSAWGVAALLAVALALVVRPVTPYPQQDVRPLVAELEKRRVPGDAVVLYPATTWAYALYTSDAISLEPEPSSSWGFAPRFADASTHPLPPGRDDPGAYRTTVDQVTGRAERVWLLASHWRRDYDALQQQLRAAGFERTLLEQRAGAELGRWERS